MTLRQIRYSGPIDIPNINGLILELQKAAQDKVDELTHYKQFYTEILDSLTSDINSHKLSEYLSCESVCLSNSLAMQVGLCNCSIS